MHWSKWKNGQAVNLLKSQSIVVALVAIFIFASIQYDGFLSFFNLTNVLRQASIIGLLAIGMTFVIITRGIDLSVGSVLALGGVLAAKLSGYGIIVSLVVPIVACGLLGLLNGLIITKLQVNPFIATLSTMLGIRGVAYIMTGEVSVSVDQVGDGFTVLGRGEIAGIPIPVIIFLLILVAAIYAAKHWPIGRHIYAVGGNEEAAKMMGLSVHRVKISVYLFSGVLSGLAGVILTSRLGAGQPVAGEGYELQAIAAVILGGTLLTGGIGKVSGTFVGVLILALITNIFNMQGNISTWWQNVLMGLILLVVVILQSITTNKTLWKQRGVKQKKSIPKIG